MDFPANSKNPNKPEKKEKVVEKVVTGEVIQKKPSLGARFKSLFLGADLKGAASYIFTDVVIPETRNLLYDAANKGMERVLYGETVARRPRRPAAGAPRVSYNTIGSRPNVRRPQPREALPKSGDIILMTREEAETVHERLMDIIENYEFASVADLHELVGLPSAHTDNKWGWYSLAHSEVRQTRDGYMLDLPSPEPQE